jgi:hypothetical protein
MLAGLATVATVARGEEPVPQGTPPALSSDMGQFAAENAMATGEVLETIDAGRYTYIQVDTGEEKIWAAAPRFAVKVGDSVRLPRGAPMQDYHSKTLNRTFEQIYFVGSVMVEGAVATPLPPPGGMGNGVAKSEPGEPDLSGIEKAEGGVTVGELYDRKDTLAGQEITVRGKVVKFTPKIMGVNWLHLRDGTAGAGGGNDLTVTLAEAEVGDIVFVRGVVATHRDFGFGYKYELMIEEASVTVE